MLVEPPVRLGAPCVAIAPQATTTTLVVTSLDHLNPTKGAVPLVLNAITAFDYKQASHFTVLWCTRPKMLWDWPQEEPLADHADPANRAVIQATLQERFIMVARQVDAARSMWRAESKHYRLPVKRVVAIQIRARDHAIGHELIQRLTEQLIVVVQAIGDEPPRVTDLIKQIQEATISLEHGHSCALLVST